MFKKLKDKLAEEVKSSPQKFQQFAQAAQAAVTSASSSISDITNNDLFSIGDNDNQQNRQLKTQTPRSQQNTFQDVTLIQPGSSQASTESTDYSPNHDIVENQRQRRLSNSSFASDVSFRLPSYEGPSSMYHLQSDMEISASEAEERGIAGGPVSLDRVTKEQLYAAYRRTQDRYTKYRTQYADLARHYKLLERDNAKAKSVLVETQDKALRRISELREQCSLEQRAKAHLEKALRVEIDDGKIKIEALNTQIKLLQKNTVPDNHQCSSGNNDEVQLIKLSNDDNKDVPVESPSEVVLLNCKIEKLEALVSKYKDSLKSAKEKNSQMTTELQILSNDIESKIKENELLQASTKLLTEAREKNQKLNEINEELQNKLNTYDFNKSKETSTLEIHLQKALEEVSQLQSKISVFTKREEENAISLAENKLSIHKELESKETEIKSLKESLTATKKEVQSLNILIDTYKKNVTSLEEDRSKLKNEVNKLNPFRSKVSELETQIKDLSQKCLTLEGLKSKADEQYNCQQLQMNQETAEKMAMIDRNTYLEKRNSQLSDENNKIKLQVSNIENELYILAQEKDFSPASGIEKDKLLEQVNQWKTKYCALESEIQEEREELIKLQSEIEKLITNHDLIQTQNAELQNKMSAKEAEALGLQNKVLSIKRELTRHNKKSKDLHKLINVTKDETKLLQTINNNKFTEVQENINVLLNKIGQFKDVTNTNDKFKALNQDYVKLKNDLNKITSEYTEISRNMSAVQKVNEVLKSKIKDKDGLHQTLDTLTKKHNETLNELKTHQQNSIEKQNIFERECEQLQAKIEKDNETITHITTQLEIALDELNALKYEKQDLLSKVDEYNSNIIHLQTIVQHNEETQVSASANLTRLESENEIINLKIQEVNNENESLTHQLRSLTVNVETNEREISNLQCTIAVMKKELDTASTNYKRLENEKENMLKTIEKYESENDSLNVHLKDLQDLQVQTSKQLDQFKSHNKQLVEKLKGIDNSEADIDRLKQLKKDLIEENLSLKKQYETMASSFRGLELEINDVRKSHEEIELEKDHLNAIILKLEKNQSNDNIVDRSNAAPYESTRVDTNANNYLEEITMNFESMKKEYDLQKEENKRLNSDIEGLQAYLLKISKENSVLNDKLRDVIATSENTPNKNNTFTQSLDAMNNDILSEKDKVDNLLRENTLLLEENLELKDQLQTQSYANRNDNKPACGNELHSTKEKYNKLLEINKTLEIRLNDLEQMNKSVNGSLNQVQQNNDKLRLSNEKLERRLDEALVSLRHLHSLQENTELEYLRNVLFEYLTGSGAHSITLAKVLAAVVKFDEMQTKVIMQKEKERQGIMRQLGLL